MTEIDAYVGSINSASAAELLAELGVSFLKQRFRRYDFGFGWPVRPFCATLGKRGGVATFSSHFRGDFLTDVGMARDFRLATALPSMGLDECYYGAASHRLYPFLCELPSVRRPVTAADILRGLNVRAFQSDHILNLDVSSLPFPGYYPGTNNDEIHNNFSEQHLFRCESAEDAEFGHHGVLKRYVRDGRVWYVLLHTWGRRRRGSLVTLIAAGHSPHGQRLVGLVTHQMCHNLCD